MSKWTPTEWTRRIGKWELWVWMLHHTRKPGTFWLISVMHYKTHDKPLHNNTVFTDPKTARIACLKLFRRVRRMDK